MNMDDIDRILMSEDVIEPSTSFSGNVMSRVQAEAAPPPKIAFPWLRFAVVMIIATAVIVLLFPSEAVARTLNTAFLDLGEWIVSPADMALRNALMLAMVSLFGTMLLILFSFRLAGAKR